VPVSIQIRPLHRDDDPQVKKLWAEAFGEDDQSPTAPPVNAVDRPGRHTVVADDHGTLAGAVVERDFTSWFGGREVPTSGIAGVTVALERRGTGLLDPLLEASRAVARERGALVSTMYPTAAGIYRRLGYEIVGALEDVEVPTADLAVAGDTVPVRRATLDDIPTIRAIYSRWAAAQHGPLTRTGPSFPTTDAEVLGEFSGITLAESSAGRITGYASWKRGPGYGEKASIRVADLFAVDRPSLVSLLRALSHHASVAPHTIIRTSGFEPWRLLLRSNAGTVVHRDPYGLAVLDVQAFAAIGYPDAIEAELPFRWNDASYLLTVSGGRGEVTTTSVPDDARTFTDVGIALAFSGSQTSTSQRLLGHLSGSSIHDSTWDALVPGPLHIRDYF